MKTEIPVILDDIRRSMEFARSFISIITYDEFQNDEKTQYAVIRCLEVIGEAMKRLPQDFRDRHPNVPWKMMTGMRDRLIHGYDVVDSDLVWIAVSKSIPPVLKEISSLIDQE